VAGELAVVSVALGLGYRFGLFSFHAAIHSRSVEVLEWLLSRRSHWRVLQDSFNEGSQLTLAALCGVPELVQLLLKEHCPFKQRLVARAIAMRSAFLTLPVCI
jgi:hypothetical protein